ncbi:hypothetical protein [Pseudarthrobacter sp. NamE2]|uniref:hypothetical protein n=1 Tax=Pseudarthrobacter sp. NamE2 TaxID=2576838 RepID=UPI001484F02A|nr:hypothetical protein [Pseudarthrobacter sp. NamE2]
MERQDLEDNSPIEVLDGQLSVEELLADLGFEWRPKPPPSGAAEAPATDIFGQPALF